MPITVQLHQSGATTTRGTIRGHEIVVDRPEAKGGADEGPMGGELLLASLAGCFGSNLLAAIAARETLIEDVVVTVEGDLAEAPSRYEAIRMHVTARTDDGAQLQKLVTMAERACIVANTLRGSVRLEVSSQPS